MDVASNYEQADQDGVLHGRNSTDDAEVGGVAVERIRSIVSRVEQLESEKKALSSDIKDIYAEGKSAGLDPTVLRRLVSLRKKDPAKVEEEETLLHLYQRALGE